MDAQVNEIDVEKAFNAVAAACSEYKGTKQEHVILELSLKAIKAKLEGKNGEDKKAD